MFRQKVVPVLVDCSVSSNHSQLYRRTSKLIPRRFRTSRLRNYISSPAVCCNSRLGKSLIDHVDLGAPPDDQQAPTSPQGTVPQSFTYPFSSLNATQLSGGSMKVVDSTNFPVATTISAAEVTVEPGAMR